VAVGEGIWHRLATGVMRRPVGVAVTGIVFLLALGVPFLGVEWGVPDDRVLPESTEVRRQSDILRDDFDSSEADAFAIVATGGATPGSIEAYAAEVSTVSGVARVDSAVGRFVDGRNVATDPSLAQFDPVGFGVGGCDMVQRGTGGRTDLGRGRAMVHDIRDLDAPFDETLVGGASAALVDSKSAIFGLVPYAAAMIVWRRSCCCS
jgi:putative drug exporter of the RND superfamily